MFAKLFKPKIEHDDPEVRLAAVKNLTGGNSFNSLSQIALNDNDERVRLQALSQLQDGFSDKTKFDCATAIRLFKIGSELRFKEKLVPLISENTQCLSLLEGLEEESSLILFALNSTIPAARKSASERVTSLDALRQLQQKSKDKNVLQVTRQKIQLIKADEKKKQAAHENLTQICEALERLAKMDYETLTTSRVHVLENHWLETEDQYKPDFDNRYQQAMQDCQLIINSAKEQAALEDYQLSQNQLCQSICDTLENEIAAVDISSQVLWKNKIEQITGQWQQVCREFTPEAQVNERFYGLTSAAEKVSPIIEKLTQIEVIQNDQEQPGAYESVKAIEQSYFTLNKQLSWPYSFNAPVLYAQIQQSHTVLKKQLQSEQKKHREKRQEIDKKVSILRSHIRQKNLIKANRLFNYIHNLLSEFPESLQEKELQKLEQVTESLNELRGLNKFVTAPKKDGLCEQMESLIDSKLEPEELMQQIKAIQDKWKSLATSDAQADDILWDRFKEAADKAYKPCLVYLKELEEIKHNNLQLRKDLAQEVETQLSDVDWQHVDWKLIQADYNQNWKKWNDLVPIFFSENKPIQQHFESLMNQVKAKLDNEKTENHALCDQLIERVVVLVDGLQNDNVEDGIEQVKRLQASWKNTGITHYNKSNKQWNKFRKLCDQIFEYQRNKHKSILAEQDQQAGTAFKIIDQVKALKKLSDAQLPASQSDFQDLKQQFSDVVELPENRQEKIEKRFKQVCDEYESHLAGLPARTKANSHSQVRKAVNLCVRAELSASTDKDRQTFDVIKAEFEAVENVPEKTLKGLAERLKQSEAVINNEMEYSAEELKQNESQLSELAIQLEVLFDLESPDHAKQQRMNYQLQRLQSGIKPTAGQQEKLTQLLEAEIQWYKIGVVNTDSRKELEARLQAVIKQAET